MLCIFAIFIGEVAIGNLDFKVRNSLASAEIKKAFLFGLYSQIDLGEKINWLQKVMLKFVRMAVGFEQKFLKQVSYPNCCNSQAIYG